MTRINNELGFRVLRAPVLIKSCNDEGTESKYLPTVLRAAW